ncbi:MAG: MBL fold metallo-hydrolase [Acidobacteria bacterium]|nr:MBL fold metallo-hydrolase [Acidobacteriota bacterium]
MRVVALELGPFAAHCVLLVDDTDGAALVVDPGFEAEAILEAIDRERLRPQAIVLTHAHLDHAAGVAEVKRAHPNARLLLHRDDLPLYENLPMQARMFGFPPPESVPPDGFLADGDRVPLGADSLLVRHCPGHSPGHIVLIHEGTTSPVAVVGDVLFAGSIGRTDLWGGSLEALERSIRTVLYALPPDTRVVCGHGPDTTIGAEMAGNPFVPA